MGYANSKLGFCFTHEELRAIEIKAIQIEAIQIKAIQIEAIQIKAIQIAGSRTSMFPVYHPDRQ
jgi:hypothetical protein